MALLNAISNSFYPHCKLVYRAHCIFKIPPPVQFLPQGVGCSMPSVFESTLNRAMMASSPSPPAPDPGCHTIVVLQVSGYISINLTEAAMFTEQGDGLAHRLVPQRQI